MDESPISPNDSEDQGPPFPIGPGSYPVREEGDTSEALNLSDELPRVEACQIEESVCHTAVLHTPVLQGVEGQGSTAGIRQFDGLIVPGRLLLNAEYSSTFQCLLDTGSQCSVLSLIL